MITETRAKPIRVFAAIRPPEAILAPLQAWWSSAQKLLPVKVWRPIPVENWHITLAFYGELDPDALPGLRARLHDIAKEIPGFGIEIRGLGVFPSAIRPRTFWVGAFGIDTSKALAGLAHLCRHATEDDSHVDIRKAPQTYRGHISLARAKGRLPVDLTPLTKQPPPALRAQVEAISLYRSDLTPEGSRYTLVERFPLKA